MSRTTVCATALVMACIWSPPCLASQPDTASMKRMYKKMKAAMGKKEEAAFKAQWHPRAYATNLVGGSGLPGKSVYRQGTRKGWYLKPQMAKLRGLPMRRGGPWIVPTLIWSDKKGKAVDMVYVLIVYKKKWMILGGGERLAEVEALGKRWVDKKPLAPPKKKSK